MFRVESFEFLRFYYTNSMATINDFEDLEIWQLGREICQLVWNLFETTSLGKDYELRNQMNRSSGSIMDNISEGFERNGRREFINFLSYSKGSCGELRSQLYRALDRNHISKEEFEQLKDKTDYYRKQKDWCFYVLFSQIKY